VGFLEAQLAFALKRPDLAPAVREFLRHYVGEAATAAA
jgi:UTP--glucose-1-phosphate uridylyltransferase